FHCNLACDYCAVASSPRADPRTLSLEAFRALVDEAVAEGFTELYLTGGEPFLHPEITQLISYAAASLSTVVLTNAMLFGGARGRALPQLAELDNLVLQTSIDGALAQTHDRHRGAGSWQRCVEGIRYAVRLGLPVRVAMTETEENAAEVPAVAALLDELGVAEGDFAVRPLLQRGLSAEGQQISEETTVPELTVTADGLHWHPAGADRASSPDMLLAQGGVSLARGKELVIEQFFTARLRDGSLPAPYACAV
ncbi:MAG: radical SAM protein, partial [Sciscionella sp.]